MAESKAKTNATDLVKFLKSFKKDAKDWDRKPIAIRGNVDIVRMPSGSLALAVNSDIKDYQSRKDKYFRSIEQYVDFVEILTEGMETNLKALKGIESTNGKIVKSSNGKSKADALVL